MSLPTDEYILNLEEANIELVEALKTVRGFLYLHYTTGSSESDFASDNSYEYRNEIEPKIVAALAPAVEELDPERERRDAQDHAEEGREWIDHRVPASRSSPSIGRVTGCSSRSRWSRYSVS